MKAKELYDVVVIGGGVGGLNVASASAQLGASVALTIDLLRNPEFPHPQKELWKSA